MANGHDPNVIHRVSGIGAVRTCKHTECVVRAPMLTDYEDTQFNCSSAPDLSVLKERSHPMEPEIC